MACNLQTFTADTVFGKRFWARRIDTIPSILDSSVGIRRTQLATRVAYALHGRNPDGRSMFQACLGARERRGERPDLARQTVDGPDVRP